MTTAKIACGLMARFEVDTPLLAVGPWQRASDQTETEKDTQLWLRTGETPVALGENRGAARGGICQRMADK